MIGLVETGRGAVQGSQNTGALGVAMPHQFIYGPLSQQVIKI